VVLVVLAVGGLVAAQILLRARAKPAPAAAEVCQAPTAGNPAAAPGGVANRAPAPGGPGAAPGHAENPPPAGEKSPPPAGKVKYVPRVSEKKMQEYLETHKVNEITEAEVYAIMGEPTRRDPPVTGRKNGQVVIVYHAHWDEPGSGVHSTITFANGRVGGVILGLEVTRPGCP
jgi:hypothetical protein